jgi:hypothetical protein
VPRPKLKRLDHLRAASRPALISIIPPRGGTPLGSPNDPLAGLGSKLASVTRRGPEPLLQDRLPPFRRRLPKEGASTWQRCLFKLSGVRYGDSHFSSCFLLYVDAFPCPILFLPLLRDCHRIFSAL